MLIKCSSCGAKAKIPDSKEGAKVKCPSCGHIYVARPAGAGGGRPAPTKDNSSAMIIGGIVVVGAAILGIIMSSSGGEDPLPVAKAEEKVEEDTGPFVDPDGWDGDATKLTRSLHQAAFSANDSKLATKLDAELAYNYVPVEETKGEELAPPPVPLNEDGTPMVDEAAAEEASTVKKPWAELTDLERIEFADGLVAKAMLAGADGAVAGWFPFDGMVKFSEENVKVVRLSVEPRDKDAGLADRYTQWTLVNEGGAYGSADQWKWINVERWVTPDEAAASRRRRKPKAQKKTLSDGSKVYESTIRPIAFSAEVPPETQARLRKLSGDLVADIDAPPRILKPIREELEQAGKDSIPALLTTMATLSGQLTDDADANLPTMIKLNWVHMMLRDVTGFETTFQVSEVMGGTKERIDSGIKQWFGWYDRKFKRFKGFELPADPLLDDPDFQPRTDEERRLYDKALKEREMEIRRLELELKKKGKG